MDGYLLGEPLGRRPELPGPAPPGHPAVRHPAPTRPWYVRVLESASMHERMGDRTDAWMYGHGKDQAPRHEHPRELEENQIARPGSQNPRP